MLKDSSNCSGCRREVAGQHSEPGVFMGRRRYMTEEAVTGGAFKDNKNVGNFQRRQNSANYNEVYALPGLKPTTQIKSFYYCYIHYKTVFV